MSLFNRRSRRAEVQEARPAIESLESRQYFSSALIVTLPGPLLTSAVAGVTVNEKIGVDIANDGPSRLQGPLTVTLYTSTDETLSSDDAQIATVTLGRGFVVQAGTHRLLRLNVKAYPQNLDDNYFILGDVTVGNTVNAVSTLGVSSSTIQVLPPQIAFTAGVPAVPHNGAVGHRIAVAMNVTNNGNILANGILEVSFSESTDASGSNAIDLATLTKRIRIHPGKTVRLHFVVPVALGSPTGNEFIVADVDPMDVYNEPTLANNIAVSGTPVTFR